MKNLMELLKTEKCVWVSMESQQRQNFLKFAKDVGFKWFTGQEISLNDNCWLTVAMFDDMTIANIPAMHRVFAADRHTVYRVNFSDIISSKKD